MVAAQRIFIIAVALVTLVFFGCFYGSHTGYIRGPDGLSMSRGVMSRMARNRSDQWLPGSGHDASIASVLCPNASTTVGEADHNERKSTHATTLGSARLKEIVSELASVSPNHPSTNEKLWIEMSYKNTLIRRTAFFDARPNLGPSVVIITLHNDLNEFTWPTFYAKLVLRSGEEICMKVEYWKKIGYVKIEWHDYYVGYLLRIKLKEVGTIEPPLYIQLSLSLNTCYSGTEALPPMPIFNDQREREGKFAVCTGKALFNDTNIDPEWIVHWVEFNRFLGASFITILIQDISDKVYNAMRPYIKEGIVEVVDWRVSVDIHEKGMWGSLQECIYRNINRAQYLSLHDSDEILVPQRHTTWNEMLDDLKEEYNISKYASFSFHNSFWFDIGLPIKSAVAMKCPKMKLPLYFTRTDRVVNPEHVHPKPMVCLDAIIAGNIHEIAHWREGYEMRLKVPVDIGQSHHFRTPLREQDYLRHDRHYDPNFMLPYVDELMTNVKRHLC